MKAIDTTKDVRPYLDGLKIAGISAIGRYYSKHDWKVMSAAEAKAISRAGFTLFAVYEDGADPSTFTPENGTAHATNAIDYAQNVIGQPKKSAIYFAVDYDAKQAAAESTVKDYFKAVNAVFAQRGAPYSIGVYSDGTVCQYLLNEGLASFAWLSQSVDHSGHKEFYASRRWTIAQGMPGIGVPDLGGDPDELNPAIPDFGGFTVAGGHTMKITIVRNPALSDGDGTFGEMLIDDAHFCVTCEQPWHNNEEGHSSIPTGDYQLLPYNSSAHGPTVVFHNPDLGIYGTPEMIPAGKSGRSLCEIHNANWPFQLKGCVAVGTAAIEIPPNGRGVTSSVATLHALFEKWGDRSGLTATIRNAE